MRPTKRFRNSRDAIPPAHRQKRCSQPKMKNRRRLPMLDRLRRSEWFAPFCISVGLHLGFLALLFLVHMAFPEKAKEEAVHRFRVKGVQNLPRIPGELGGGNLHSGGVLKFTSKNKRKPGSVNDVAMQNLVEQPM